MKVKELLTNASRWTTGVMARDKDGLHVPYSGSSARCWCLLGAVAKCYPDPSSYYFIVNKIKMELGHDRVDEWNDGKQFEDVRELAEKLDI